MNRPRPTQGIDPRCFGKKIEAPEPLPFVSRRALQKVRHYLKPITECHLCGGSVALVENRAVYEGRSFGEWPYVYLCGGCGAYVGLHSKTDLPLGYLATASDREARRAAKIPFATLVRCFGDRSKAYKWLANELSIEPLVCHFSMFDEDEAIRAFNACYAKLFDL